MLGPELRNRKLNPIGVTTNWRILRDADCTSHSRRPA
jgi:hypothetical protein